jgi:hypothetical protein
VDKKELANKNRKRGHRQQNRVAKLTGGVNVGGLGGEDISHCEKIFNNKVSIETKALQRFSGKKILDQAIKNCPEDKIPVAWIHINNQRVENDIIMVRLKDLKEFKKAIINE